MRPFFYILKIINFNNIEIIVNLLKQVKYKQIEYGLLVSIYIIPLEKFVIRYRHLRIYIYRHSPRRPKDNQPKHITDIEHFQED